MRIGVVGAGYMGRSYARVLHHHPTATLAGVADQNRDLAERSAAEFGVTGYSSAEAMLNAEALDGVIVATFEDAHVRPALAALERRVGVLIEKPLASTIEDAETIVAAAENAGSVLLVGHILRFDTRYVLLHDAVRSGQIGRPLTVYARRWNGKAAQRRLAGRSSVVLFLGVHDYDIARWTLGSEVVRVVSVERRGFLLSQGYDVEDAVTAILTFADGTLATIESGWVLPDGRPIGFDFRLEVNGTEGSANVIADYSGLSIVSDTRETWVDTALWPEVQGRITGALERQINHFIECLQDGVDPIVTGRDGLIAVKVALAVTEAARTGRPVELRREDADA